MKLPTLAALAPLATLAVADYVEVWQHTYSWDAYWHTAYGSYGPLNWDGGCRNMGAVPALNQVCIDWQHNRAHFYFDGQPKRCLSFDKFEWGSSCPLDSTYCYSRWNEVPCTW